MHQQLHKDDIVLDSVGDIVEQSHAFLVLQNLAWKNDSKNPQDEMLAIMQEAQ